MLKLFISLFFSFAVHGLIHAQDSINIKIASRLTASAANTIKLYKFNPSNPCNQSKAVSVIKDNQLTTCFDYVKTIDVVNTKKLISVLSVPSSYGAEDVACFTTQYGMVVLDRSGVIIGYINLSLSCNKLISNPVIREREHFSHNGLRLVGFSTSGRTKLLALLGITEAKK